MNFGFIGAGNMSCAIIKGIISKQQAAAKEIYVYDIQTEKLNSLSADLGDFNYCLSNKEVVEKCEFVFLAVKPNVLESVLKEISVTAKDKGAILTSIAAGKSIAFIEKALGESLPVIRVMPNMNAMVGESMSALCKNNLVSDSQFETVKKVFSSIGKTVDLDEKQFSIFVGLSGSAPAYVYLFIDSIARAGVKAGLDKKTSLEIAAQSVFGSAKTVMECDKHPWELIDMVCSPGGTTIDGISSMLENGFESAVMKAVEAVIKKDKSL